MGLGLGSYVRMDMGWDKLGWVRMNVNAIDGMSATGWDGGMGGEAMEWVGRHVRDWRDV